MSSRSVHDQFIQSMLGFLLTFFVVTYSITVLTEAIKRQDTYQTVLSAIASVIVLLICMYLLYRTIKLYKKSEKEMKDS